MKPWVGVDLDGTLAEYDHWRGVEHIGAPVPTMVKLVRGLLKSGTVVKVFTARASESRPEVVQAVERWTRVHIGEKLEVTNVKDYGCLAIIDDRAVACEPNTGDWTTRNQSVFKMLVEAET